MNTAPQLSVAACIELSPEKFRRFARLVTERLGIKMPEPKSLMLQGRLTRRIRELRLSSIEEYEAYLFDSQHSEQECIHFMDAVTTNKTDFFREPAHFDYLTNRVLPALTEGQDGRYITIWSAGCSSGEEPYTLAMAMSEYAREHPGVDFGILGTDISTRVLAHGVRGIYDFSRIEDVPLGLRARYLMRDRTRSRVRIVPALRKKVSFHRLNLMDDDYRVRTLFDVIFFRNVMIYFDRETQQNVINKLCRNLHEGGMLFVGHSESITSLKCPLVQVSQAVFQKRT